MDLEAVLKRIEKLESRLKSITKTLSSHNNQLSGLEENSTKTVEQIRDLKNEASKLNSSLNSLGNFDAALTRLRIDISRQIEESEKRQKLNVKTQEKLTNSQFQSIEEKVASVKADTEKKFDQKLNLFLEEDRRIIQQFKEMQASVENKLNDDDEIKGSIDFIQQELSQQKKIIESLSNQMDLYIKRLDDLRVRQDSIQSAIKTDQSQLNEIVATESERRQSFVNFMEQQTLTKSERDRTWLEWQEQFKESIQQVNSLLPELQKKQIDLDKLRQTFQATTDKMERRINEVTEMYRLMDEKFRQEWSTFKSDLEKRWTNISLVMDEKQTELSESFQSYRDRILKVEDETQEMQEALILMSSEVQKGMQSLMNMVNGWIDAFGQIKTKK